MADIEMLAQTIRDRHGVTPTHIRSEHVHERFAEVTAWEGTVEVFTIGGHPIARLAFAWTEEGDDGALSIVAILGIAPIASAVDAVRAHIDGATRDGL